MNQLDTLARVTLDTLPLNVAVLDEDGTILFTNRAWREFAGAGPAADRDMVGVNYFGATDTEGDEHASAALEGLRTVIDGDEDLFTLEYPCHSPDEKRWFLMRATRLHDTDQGQVVVAHIDITERKLAELRVERQRRDLERLTDRLHGLVGDVMESVLHARTREEIESTVCGRLVDVPQYVSAWVGRSDLRTDEVVPVACGTREPPADASIPLDDEDDPTVRALSTGAVVDDVTDLDALAPLHRTIAGDDAGALVALPLIYGDANYGVLTVYAADEDAIDDRELAVLEALARVTSTAINAVEGRRILTADEVVELELELSEEGPFYRDLAAALDCRLSYEGTIYDDEGVRMLFVADGVDPETLEAAAREHEAVDAVSVLGGGGEASTVVEFGVDEPPVVAMLADQGAETTAIEVDGRAATLTVELPVGTDARAVIDQLGEQYPSVELRARRERDRSERTRRELVADIEERLTDRQRLALQKAYLGGFFDWPRETSGEDVAASMDISPSTFHQHLRTAERKVLASLFEE